MPEAVFDSRANSIVADVAATLQGLTINGTPIFESAKRYDDAESFIRVADSFANPSCGIVESGIQQGSGSDNSETDVCRMLLEVLIRFAIIRKPLEDEGAATAAMNNYASMVRNALRNEPTRGGSADRIVWGGAVLDGTDTRGAARFIARVPNNGFYVVGIPIAVGWSITE